ncbi:hypothetical protein EVG20_g6471 [Dentipellis fragilis]|uniref:Uncharacterized protein n=1 Tax=Dentipellis fragilis TaxID=205917 RepID=A0A4Y9YMP0_9AGAM|nr:hypothetical protein EVG20_g6471 [Dentipellis fragilis]
MSSASDSHSPPDNRAEESSVLVVVPVQPQSGTELPLSKHDIAIHAIKLECREALHRMWNGEIPHEEFMRIANDCVERAQARRAATKLACERALRGEITKEEFNDDCGYDEEEWERSQPAVEMFKESLIAGLRHSEARYVQNRSSRGH